MPAKIYMKTCLFSPHMSTLIQTFEVCSRIEIVNMNFCTTVWKLVRNDDDSQNPNLPYQRTRGTDPGRVILNRNSESTLTGIFRCDIPSASGVLQSLYVGIYTSTTGECRTWSNCRNDYPVL